MSEGLHFPISALIEKHLLAVFSNRVPIAWILACDFAPILEPVSNKKSWVVWFAYQILLWKCSVLSHFWSPASRESFGEYLSKTFLSFFLFFLFSLPQVYDIQGNLQDGSQVVVSIIFENKCDSFLKSMEFNVLDSLNSKLQRPEGSGPHDGLTVPFQLPPGQSLPAHRTPVMDNNKTRLA